MAMEGDLQKGSIARGIRRWPQTSSVQENCTLFCTLKGSFLVKTPTPTWRVIGRSALQNWLPRIIF